MRHAIDDIARIIAADDAPRGEQRSRRGFIGLSAKVAGAVLASTGAGALLAGSASAVTRYCNQAPCNCRAAADPNSGLITTLSCGTRFNAIRIEDSSTRQGTSCGVTNRVWFGLQRSDGSVRCFIHSGSASTSPVSGRCCNQRSSGETTPAGG